jgi:hypothetical protein
MPDSMQWLGPEVVGAVKAGTAAAGALLLGVGALRSARGRPPGRVFDAFLAGLGLLAAACWWNLGRFNYPMFGHPSETYHYYVGAKYFPELGYTGLYRCTALADAESGHRAEVEARYARDLGTNRIVPAAELLRDPATCKARFARERWRSFRRDVRFFRERIPVERWQRTQVDHGYNATPAWGLVGGLLARTGPATERQILLLRLLDPLLLAATGLAIAWAFGWRTLCVAAIYWGTSYPAQYGWVGGSYLRQPELAALLIGICCLRRGRPATAGALLAVASLVRVFPAVAFAGVALRAGWLAVAARRLTVSPAHRRFALSALATVAILVPLSGVAAGGFGAWPAFLENSRLLLDTPLRNHVGLRTLLAYDPATTARALEDPSLDDPYARWKEARRRTFEARRWVFVACVAGFAVLLAAAIRRTEDWSATVLAVGLAPIALELTCYYWAVLTAYAFLWKHRPWVGAALCALAAAGWAIADRWVFYDEVFPWISSATAGFVLLVTIGHAVNAPRLRGNASRPFRLGQETTQDGKGRAGLSQTISALGDQAVCGRRRPLTARPRRPRPKSAAPAGSGTARNSVMSMDPGPEAARISWMLSTSAKSTPANSLNSSRSVPGPVNTKGSVSEPGPAPLSCTKTEIVKEEKFETLETSSSKASSGAGKSRSTSRLG